MSKRLRIEVYFAPGCPSKGLVEKNLQKALESDGISAELLIETLSEEEALKMGFKGSPTIIINGEEFQPLEQGGWT